MERKVNGQPTGDAIPSVLPRHVKLALDFMLGNISEKITLAGLASACASSERTLLKQFREFVGVPPLAYLRRLRLNLARGELLNPDNEAAVAGIAVKYGLSHLGRFAIEYRRAFGETPTATRQRVRARKITGASPPQPASGYPAAWHAKPALMILPFRTATLRESGEARDLTERLAATLSRMGATTVSLVHPSRARTMNSSRPRPRNAGTEYYLTGRLAHQAQKTRVIVALIDAATDRHLWGDSFDGVMDDPFELQDRAVDGVLLGVVSNILKSVVDQANGKDPRDLLARDLAMRAWPLVLNADLASNRKAMEILNRALQLDPADAHALVLLGCCHNQRGTYFGSLVPMVERGKGLALASRAQVLDSGGPFVAAARAQILTQSKYRGDVAHAQVTRALAMDPTSAWAWERSGHRRLNTGNEADGPDKAIADFRRALQLYGPTMPRSNLFGGIATAHARAGRMDEAIRWTHKALAENPGATLRYSNMIHWAIETDDRSMTANAVDKFRRAHPDMTVALTALHVCDWNPRWLETLHREGIPL